MGFFGIEKDAQETLGKPKCVFPIFRPFRVDMVELASVVSDYKGRQGLTSLQEKPQMLWDQRGMDTNESDVAKQLL